MLHTIKYKLTGLFKVRNELSEKVVKNIILSFGVKGGSIAIGLIVVPLTISYVNPIQYGIWLTISSVVNWLSFFDVGLGHGLRNKLAASLAFNKYEEAKTYVSTTYAMLFAIASLLFICLYFINPLLNWRELLNIPASVGESMQPILLIVFCSFCIQFVVQLVNTILTATHQPAIAGLITFLGQVGVLLTICVLKFTTIGSLYVLVSALTIVPIIILILSSLYLYASKLKYLAPSVRYIKFSCIKEILNVGGTFFFIQIGALVLLQMNNIVITKTIGPAAVTDFNVAYKLFSVISMAFIIILTPYWSAFTNAYAKGDYNWMKKNIFIMRITWIVLSVATVLMLFCSPYLYDLWLGDKVTISFSLSIAMAAYLIVFMWQTLHVYFLNGVGKIKLQLVLVLIAAAINLPLAIYLGKIYGIAGIISANTIVFFAMGIVFTIQTQYILKGKEAGFWSR